MALAGNERKLVNMSNKMIDTKLARLLQKRGTWLRYSSCLREVQNRLAIGLTPKEIRERIAEGKLDPPKGIET